MVIIWTIGKKKKKKKNSFPWQQKLSTISACYKAICFNECMSVFCVHYDMYYVDAVSSSSSKPDKTLVSDNNSVGQGSSLDTQQSASRQNIEENASP